MQIRDILAQNSEHVSVPNPVARATSAGALAGLGFIGVSSWADIAAMFAAIYSFLLISEWFWRKFWRPVFERWGWVKPLPRRRKDDRDERWERDA